MLDQLYSVQTKDLELDTLDIERNQTPQVLLDTKGEHEALLRQLTEQRHRHDEIRRQVNANELELESLNTRRRDAVQAALNASSGKEASQYQNQELQFATRVQELEEDTLPLIETLEGYSERITALEAQVAEIEPRYAEMVAQEDARVATIDEKIATIKLSRDALASEVGSALLKQYEHVRRARRGIALVPLLDQQRCGGCNVKLPLHVIQKAKKTHDVTRCPSCGRLLWAKD